MLEHDAFLRAQDVVLTQARPLERALYMRFFLDGAYADVVATLAAHQNPDGGFGHALEPDVRTSESSALATSIALRWLYEAGVPGSEPMVGQAIGYLRATWDEATHTWPLIPPAAQAAPHAPWWDDSDGELPHHFGDFLVNCRAEILAYLWHYADLVPTDWLMALTEDTVAAILAQPQDMHALICAVALLDMPLVPAAVRERLHAPLAAQARALCGASAADWANYGPQPLNYATAPTAALAGDLADLLPANLDFLEARQAANGAWEPNWTWGDEADSNWQAARRDWMGHLTLTTLLKLRAFDRIPESE
jgi:hypothetical protein